MWDDRYSSHEYAYGTLPNDFLKEHVRFLPMGRILSIAEGEGRNAVFLAEQGFAVTAMDASRVGLDKAQRLPDERGVSLTLVCDDLATFDFGDNAWDGIVSIFCPLPAALRASVHARIIRGLKPGGTFLIEAYRPEQLNYATGGGKSAETMVSLADLRKELAPLNFQHLEAMERNIIEGSFHTGVGAVVQAIASKPR